MLAGLALQTDIGPQAHDLPIISAAGMRLSQADNVANLKVDGHVMFSNENYTPGG